MVFRGFISVDFQPWEKLEAFSRALAETEGQLKLVSVHQLHLTLKFLGETDETLVPSIVEIMHKSVAGMKPFKVRLEGTGAFPSLNYISVIWVGVSDSNNLIAVADRLNRDLVPLGFPREKRKFSPHVTLARVKGRRNVERVVAVLKDFKDEVFGEEEVRGIRLRRSVLSSAGPEYSTVQEVLFQG